MTTNPMQVLCGAHCRTTGEPCKNYPMADKARCRMHGGKSTGRPITSGFFTKEALRDRRAMAKLNREIRELLRAV